MSESTNNQSVDTPKKIVKKRKCLKRILYGFFFVLLTIFIFLVWLLSSHLGLKFALLYLPKLAGTHIQTKTLEGTIWNGFSATGINIHTESVDIHSKRFVFKWQPQDLLKWNIHINQIIVGEALIVSHDNASKDSSPLQFPDSVGLPINVQVDELLDEGILFGKDQQILIKEGRLNYSYKNKQHQLNIISLESPWSHLVGQLSLNNNKPFTVQGRIDIDGYVDESRTEGYIIVSGDLKKTHLKAILTGASSINADLNLSIFENILAHKIQNIDIQLDNFNPQAFVSSAPQANISAQLNISPQQNKLVGFLEASNKNPHFFDESGLPLRSIHADFDIDKNNSINLSKLEAIFLNHGLLSASGQLLSGEKLDFAVDLKQLSTQDFITTEFKEKLTGTVAITGTLNQPDVQWQLKAQQADIQGKLRLLQNAFQNTLYLDEIKISNAKGGELSGQGFVQFFNQKTIEMNFIAQQLNPAVFHKDYPQGNINGLIKVHGEIENKSNLKIDLDIHDSHLSQEKLTGKGFITLADNKILDSDIRIHLGKNLLHTKGSLGQIGDQLYVDIDAPDLSKFGFGISGLLYAKGSIAGSYDQLQLNLKGKANQLKLQKLLNLNQLDFQLLVSTDYQKPLLIDLKGNQLFFADIVASKLNISAKGNMSKHHLSADTAIRYDNKDYNLKLSAAGGLNNQDEWRGLINQLNLTGALRINLQNRVDALFSSHQVKLGEGRWQLFNGELNLKNLSWQEKQGLKSQGTINNIHLEQLKQIIELPIEQNIVVSGQWNIHYGQNSSGFIKINRQSGDIIIPQRSQRLELNQLVYEAKFIDNHIKNSIKIATKFGYVDGEVSFNNPYANGFLQAPITGYTKINSDNLNVFKYFLPVGMNISGKVNADLRFQGNLENLRIQGPIKGSGINYVDSETGVILSNGVLDSHFEGEKWIIKHFTFTRKEGTADVFGHIDLMGNQPNIDLDVVVNQYPILNKPDQQVTFSGQSKVLFREQSGLVLVGDIKLDKALFDFPKSSMPQLSDDVLVVGQKKKEAGLNMPISLDLRLDLDDKFQFSGQGLNVLMGGKLNLNSKPHEEFKLLGSVNVVKGRYKAYGQDLEVERGSITFTGPIANPALNIRAKRRMSPVGAGVEVSGSVEYPHIMLLADEPMSDKDKLAWLVLGRSAAGSADNEALALAAGTMLAGGINDKIGLVDDIGFSSRQTRNISTGEMNPAEQLITVGKQVSQKLYFGYEYGIDSAEQAVKLIFQLTKSIQLIGRIGSISSQGEIRYSIRFD